MNILQTEDPTEPQGIAGSIDDPEFPDDIELEDDPDLGEADDDGIGDTGDETLVVSGEPE